MRKVTIVNIESVRAMCMDEDEFWKHLNRLPSASPLVELDNRVAKLNYTKLRAYVLKLHFMLRDLVESVNESGLPFDEQVVVQNAIIAMVQGRLSWEAIDIARITQPAIAVFDFDHFINHVHELYWKRFVVESKSIRDNPAILANAVYSLDKFASMKPSWFQG